MDVKPDLITACVNRDRRAEYALFKACFSYLMSICIRYTRNEDKAHEVLNMGFYRILSNLDKYQHDQPFKPWARRVMINTLINEYNKEKTHHENVQYVETYFDSQDYSSMNNALDKINASQIHDFIAKLPPASRQVFNLYFIDGFKHKEIAEMLEISEGTSKWHLNSAREKLKEMLNNIDQPVNSISQ